MKQDSKINQRKLKKTLDEFEQSCELLDVPLVWATFRVRPDDEQMVLSAWAGIRQSTDPTLAACEILPAFFRLLGTRKLDRGLEGISMGIAYLRNDQTTRRLSNHRVTSGYLIEASEAFATNPFANVEGKYISKKLNERL